MNNGVPLQEWTTDDVGRWLAEHQLRHLISRFESLGITGEHLIVMDDNMMRNDLRITNPGERAAISGALMNIRTADPHRTFTMQERPRSSSFEQKKSSPNTRLNTMPPQRHRTVPSRRSAEMLIAPAPQLLDDACRHSGWIRKMGGSYKSWKQRYLILRLGHLYYYENESAKAPKGHFPLRGYIAEATTEIKKFPWVFKLRHNDSKMRTYYIGVAAKHELEQWVTQLNKEIQEMSTGLLSKTANTFPHTKNSSVISPQDVAQCESDEDDQALYDEVPGEEEDGSEDDTPYEQMQEEPHYDSVPQESHSDDEREEEYEQIEENQFVPPRPHPSPIPPRPSMSPTHSHPPSSAPPPGSSWPHYPPRPGQAAPIIPPRTMESLSTSLSQTDSDADSENPYLSILGQSAPGSVPTTPASVTSESGYGQQPHIVHNNHSERQDEPSLDPTEEENPYYITLGSVCDVMPDHCVFGTISRDDAESRLSKSHRIGTYLLRDGHHQGAVKVLSVWAGQKCRHYKLYKEEKGFCLTHGDGFPTIPMLLQHYKENEMLPKSEYNLGEPYHPLDH